MNKTIEKPVLKDKTNKRKAINANVWKSKLNQTILIDLPSGVTVEVLKSINIIERALSGYIPFPLLHSVMQLGEKLETPDSWDSIDETTLKDFSVIVNDFIVSAVVNPKISKTPTGDEIDVNLIPMSDKFALFTKMNGEDIKFALSSFR